MNKGTILHKKSCESILKMEGYSQSKSWIEQFKTAPPTWIRNNKIIQGNVKTEIPLAESFKCQISRPYRLDDLAFHLLQCQLNQSHKFRWDIEVYHFQIKHNTLINEEVVCVHISSLVLSRIVIIKTNRQICDRILLFFIFYFDFSAI